MRAHVIGLMLVLSLATVESHAVDCRLDEAVRYIVCRVNLDQEKLRLAWADPQGRRYESFAALEAGLNRAGQRLSFAMNAGMFHPDFRPVGLLVIDGKELAPINRSAGSGNFFVQPNGVFLIDAEGARVLSTDDYRGLQPYTATQSGPMLVHRGTIPSSSVFREDTRFRFRRNGVCAPSARQVALVISDEPVTFAQFARYFRDTLGCSEALYLDGSVSSIHTSSRRDDHAKLGPLFYVAVPLGLQF